jgi:hypothetical protein
LVITLNNLAKEYGLLPSEALSRATTFDLYVLDVSTRWLIHRQNQAEGVQIPKSSKPSQEQLLAMIKKVRGEGNES